MEPLAEPAAVIFSKKNLRPNLRFSFDNARFLPAHAT
jgi:hypothetical protein